MNPQDLQRTPAHRQRIFILDALTRFGFKSQHIVAMTKAESLAELGDVAQRHISKLESFCIGIGPMTTGKPLRSVDQNFEIFRRVYGRIHQGGLPGPRNIFFQLLFETDIKRLADTHYDRKHNEKAFYDDLFQHFYRPIMMHERLVAVWRMPDWENSIGAQIEYDILSGERVRSGVSPVQFYDAIDHVDEVRSLLT